MTVVLLPVFYNLILRLWKFGVRVEAGEAGEDDAEDQNTGPTVHPHHHRRP